MRPIIEQNIVGHSWSSFGVPPAAEIVTLPDHDCAQTLSTNDRLAERLRGLASGGSEFFTVDIPD